MKDEERIVHFLDAKGMIRQRRRAFVHEKAPACARCALDPICAGVDGLGEFHDAAQLAPIFVDPAAIVARIHSDGA